MDVANPPVARWQLQQGVPRSLKFKQVTPRQYSCWYSAEVSEFRQSEEKVRLFEGRGRRNVSGGTSQMGGVPDQYVQ